MEKYKSVVSKVCMQISFMFTLLILLSTRIALHWVGVVLMFHIIQTGRVLWTKILSAGQVQQEIFDLHGIMVFDPTSLKKLPLNVTHPSMEVSVCLKKTLAEFLSRKLWKQK